MIDRCFIIFILGLVCVVAAQEHRNAKITKLSFAKYNASNSDDQAIDERIVLQPKSGCIVEINDIPETVSFLILQAHTHESNVTLSYVSQSDCMKSECGLSGTNVGLAFTRNENGTVNAALSNEDNKILQVLIAAVAYFDEAPIPGGCNMEFDLEISSYQKLYYDNDVVILENQPPSAPSAETPCVRNQSISVATYRLYLPSRDLDPETYFAGIKKMLTVEEIVKNGVEIPSSIIDSPVRRVFGAYPGTGSIYATIATYGNYSSAYVPVATYSCSPRSNPSSCYYLDTSLAHALCAITLIVGLIVTFVGHNCLRFQIMFTAGLTGGIISFTILKAIGTSQTSVIVMTVTSFLAGFSCFVLSYCLPMFVNLLASIPLSFLAVSALYVRISDITLAFESDANFWLFFAGTFLLLSIVCMVFPFIPGNIGGTIIGAYSIIISIDYYASTNLKYIMINCIRRIAVEGFNVSNVRPPYETTDMWLVFFLMAITFLGIYTKFGGRMSCGSCIGRNRSTTVYWNATQPILSEPRRNRRVLVFGTNDHVVHNY